MVILEVKERTNLNILTQKFIIFLFSLLLASGLKAQLQKPTKNGYFLKLKYGNGSHFTLGTSLHHINKKGYSITSQFLYESRDANNIPGDFVSGGLFSRNPFVYIESIGVMAGKVFLLEDSKTQFNLKVGVNFGRIIRPINFKKQATGGFRLFPPDNYSYDLEQRKFIGLLIEPTINLLVSRFVGFSFGLRTNINHQDITAGFEVGLLLGYLRGSLIN